ncbi:14177_t:CDS:2, partial [Entrophospora sp. SA101]
FPFVAVSIGLTINKEPVVGVVFNPFLNELYTASKGDAATLNSKKGGLVRSIRSLECASLNICTVAKGHFDGCAASIVILQEAGGIMVNGQGPDEGPDNILGHKFLAIRGGLPCSSDENSRQSQIHLVREMWGLVEEIDCPRY